MHYWKMHVKLKSTIKCTLLQYLSIHTFQCLHQLVTAVCIGYTVSHDPLYLVHRPARQSVVSSVYIVYTFLAPMASLQHTI